MKAINSLKNRLVALMLSIIMVLSMVFSTSVFTIDATHTYGTAKNPSVGAVSNLSETEVKDPYTDPTVVVVDTIGPNCTISYNASNVVNIADMKDTTDFTSPYVMYFSKDAEVTIAVTEANFNPDQFVLTVQDDAGNAVQTWEQTGWEATAEACYTNIVKIATDGDYRIKVCYQDVDYLSSRIVVDKTTPEISVTYSNTNVKNAHEGREYFTEAQQATITIKEHNFRAEDVLIKVTAKDISGNDILTLDSDGNVVNYTEIGANKENWTPYIEGAWRVENDTYTITLDFVTEANYTFAIECLDLAKNKAANYEPNFTIDKTPPKNLTVSYSKTTSSMTGYYNTMMTVTMTAQDDISPIHHFVYSYIKGKNVSDVNAEMLDQLIKAANITYSNNGKTATAKFDIPQEILGDDQQFNGTVEFTAYDCSENNTSLKDKKTIVLDSLPPTAQITYSAPVRMVDSVSYYNDKINAVIVVEEANFDAKDVVITATKNGKTTPIKVKWEHDTVDIHTGMFTLTGDGEYIVKMQYVDKSGNEMEYDDLSGETVHFYQSNVLILDTAKPTIKVSNIKADTANNVEKYEFVITVNDAHLAADSFKPTLTAIAQNEDGTYRTIQVPFKDMQTVVEGKTYTYTVENLPEDGLYTLLCRVEDMSRNSTSQIVLEDGQSYEQVQFSINRSGSTFGYGNQFSEKLVKQYYVHSVGENVIIEEVNVDPVENYKVIVNGKELVEGTDYTTTQITEPGKWSKRTYSINKELFDEEGEYSIIVSSIDKADTTSFSDVKNLSFAFVVDQTEPVLTIAGLGTGGRYQTDAQTVTVIPTDEGGKLSSLTVLVMDSDGNPLKDDNGVDISVRFDMAGEELLKYLEENDGKATFTIPEGLNNQVRIICNDCAVNAEGNTNEFDETFTKVTVSQSQWIIFYANTPLFIGTIVGVLVAIGLIIFLIKHKNDKKNKAAAKA